MRPLLFVLGWLCFALGAVGAFVPVLPTTPFLLLAAVCFSKSSPRFHAWLLDLPVLGEGVRDWRQSKVIRPRAKALCGAMIGLSLVLLWRSERVPPVLAALVSILLLSVGLFVLTRRSRA